MFPLISRARFLNRIFSFHTKNRYPATILFNNNYCFRLNILRDFVLIRTSADMNFNVENYDCIGFDLDNTLCEYNIGELVQMEYQVISDFLVGKGYDEVFLKAFLDEDAVDFLQRGLLLDFERGNIIKLGQDGEIIAASHGLSIVPESEIAEINNGPIRQVIDQFCKDLTLAKESHMQEKFRLISDYFDMPAALAFARCVDDVDSKGKKDYAKCGRDILDGLKYMYNRDHFATNQSDYFRQLKDAPDQYINKCSAVVIEWLKELAKSKPLFLITGSHIDHASFTATHCLGENWRDLFKVVICFACKPGFFKGGRKFRLVDELKEHSEVNRPLVGGVYSQGNWIELLSILKSSAKSDPPRCLYFGDNLLEDVYAPVKYSCCDTVAIVEELAEDIHAWPRYIKSNRWGSFYAPESLWGAVVRQYSKTMVPSLKNFAIADEERKSETAK